MLKNGGIKLEQIEITLRNTQTGDLLPVYIDVADNSLSRRWLTALNELLAKNYHLEKNYCWFGWHAGPRTAEYICDQINQSVSAINAADMGYQITDHFDTLNTITAGAVGNGLPGGKLIHHKLNQLHRYFEDLQGVSGAMSPFYTRADSVTRWHIRQLNLLCHEYESLVLSMRKAQHAPEWVRPSQLMCWLNAPRFVLEPKDYELFGIETINRQLGGVYVGVNKAVGKHHWEVFQDEGRDSRIDELTTTTLKPQTEAAGDFDIEWARDPGAYPWQIKQLAEFREWLLTNGFDPEDKTLTIGHPRVAQVNLVRTFGTEDAAAIWTMLNDYLDVYSIKTSTTDATYTYHWSDADFRDRQIQCITKGQ
jgi:hypothetical protein